MSGLLGTDPLDGARWLHALLFTLNVLLVGIITYFSTNRSVSGSLCSILLFLSSAQMLIIHTMAWSESSFLLFSLSALLLLELHIVRSSIWLLLGSSIFLCLALTTRYIGIALLPPMILVTLFLKEARIKARIRDSFILLTIGISPLAFWVLRNIMVAQSATNRTLAFHPFHFTHIRELADTMYDLWLPISCQDCFKIPQLLFALTCGAVFTGFLLVLRDELRGKAKVSASRTMQTLTVLFSITYVSFLFASISFVDAHTPLDARIMSPVHVLVVIFFVSVSWSISNLRKNPYLWWGFPSFSFLLIGLNAGPALTMATHLRNEGNQYTSRTWRNSESIAYVGSLPKGLIVYSNGPDVISFLTGKEAVSIPHRVDYITNYPNSDFERELWAMKNKLIQNGALIVYFDSIDWRWYLPTKEELEDVHGIPLNLRLKDGTVYATDKTR